MSRDLRLLEELVSKAAERLSGLRDERDRLKTELLSLRAQLEATGAPVSRADGGEIAGEGRKAEWVTALREVVAELRGD